METFFPYGKKTPSFFTENMYCLIDQADGTDRNTLINNPFKM